MPPTFRPRGYLGRKGSDLQRGSARDRGYDADWDRAALAHKHAHPLCLGCEAMGFVTPVAVVDHVEPHKGDPIKFWNARLWQSACEWHHRVVKARLEAMYARGEIKVDDLWLNSAVAVAFARGIGGPKP